MKRFVRALFAAVPLAVACLLAGWSMPAVAALPGEVALQTPEGPVTLHVVQHASFVLQWNDRTIVVDPTGPASRYTGFGAPDLVLITHAHDDHMSPQTLAGLDLARATLVEPRSVADALGRTYGKARHVMANGDRVTVRGIGIEAVPMYNLPAAGKSIFHPMGWGNGYVLTLAGRRIYISGDTEGTPAMRALKHIDLAFVCMNLPYTMNVHDAADAVLAFAPAVVYPYHYRGQDPAVFRREVEAKNPRIDVRLRDWYAK